MPNSDCPFATSVERFLRIFRFKGSIRLNVYFLEEKPEPVPETSVCLNKFRQWTKSKEGIVYQYEISFFLGGGEIMQATFFLK